MIELVRKRILLNGLRNDDSFDMRPSTPSSLRMTIAD